MANTITTHPILRYYLDLRHSLRTGRLGIEPLLECAKKNGTFIFLDDEKTERKPDFGILYSSGVFSTKQLMQPVMNQVEDDDVLKCLTMLAETLPEEILSKVVMLFSAIASKNEKTAYHSARVCMISAKLGKQCNLDEQKQIELVVGALLHDIGKIKFPPAIFFHEGELSPKQYEFVSLHPVHGVLLLKEQEIEQLPGLLIPVGSHHENLNGTGYPDGVKGSHIPLLAKIVKLADCLDAMTEKRHYQEQVPLEIAIDKIRKARGTEFDRDLVVLLERIINELSLVKI